MDSTTNTTTDDEDKHDPIVDIETTVWRILRLAYLRPLLKDSKIKPFQMSEDEISNMIDDYTQYLSADMDMLSECLKAARELGSCQPEPMDHEIVIEGNKDA